jgi:hypothetical protein
MDTDELATLIKLQCNGKSVTDFLIKAYSNKSWDIGRKTGGTQSDIHIEIPYLSTVSTTQPATAKKILLTPELQGNGYISRNLISVILADDERTPEIYPYVLTDSDIENYNEFMLSLYEKCNNMTISLSSDAKEYLAYIEYLHKNARQDEPSSVFKGFHGKMGEPIRKVALNLHMMQYADAFMRGKTFDVHLISKEVIEASYGLVRHLTIDALEKLFGTISESEEDKMRDTLINMYRGKQIHEWYEADITLRYYVTLADLFDRTKRRFTNNRELLRETLRNCPNLGMLSKARMQGKNGRWYQTEVFYISDEMQVILEAEK